MLAIKQNLKKIVLKKKTNSQQQLLLLNYLFVKNVSIKTYKIMVCNK